MHSIKLSINGATYVFPEHVFKYLVAKYVKNGKYVVDLNELISPTYLTEEKDLFEAVTLSEHDILCLHYDEDINLYEPVSKSIVDSLYKIQIKRKSDEKIFTGKYRLNVLDVVYISDFIEVKNEL